MNNHTHIHNKFRSINAILFSLIFFFASLAVYSPVAYASDETPFKEIETPSSEPTAPIDLPEVSEPHPSVAYESAAEPEIITEADGTQYASGEVIVKFKNTSNSAIMSTLEAADSEIQQSADNVVVADVPMGETMESFIDSLEAQPNVEYAQPNYMYHVDRTVNDPYVSYQWHLGQIGAPSAWDMTMGLPDIRVAVLDTGIDLTHPEFAGQICAQADTVDNDGNAGDTVDGHGTHVSGIIAGKADNGIGIAGIAPGVQLIEVDVFDGDGAWTFDIVEGIQFAVANGADVINMSFGGEGSDAYLESAINNAVNAGVVCVAAAGNDDTDDYCNPSDFESVISVIATDSTDTRAYFSNFGSAKDISAPGVSIASTYPRAIYASGYAWASGTSMAAPVVSGVVALMRSLKPDLSVNEIKNILYNTAVDLGDPGKDDYYANGRVDAYAAVRDIWDDLPSYDISVTKTLLDSSASDYGTITEGGTYKSRSQLTLTAAPKAGYRFVRWTESGSVVSTNSSYSFLTTRNMSLNAEFKEDTYTISALSNNASYGNVSGGGTYDNGTSVTLTAWPNSGYRFARWTENGVEVSANPYYTVAVTRDMTLTAEFVPLTPISINCTKTDATIYGAANGTITASSSGGDGAAHLYNINSNDIWHESGYFSGLAAGTYTVSVRDMAYPENTASCSVTIGEPAYAGSVPANRVPSKPNAGTAVTLIPPAAPRGYTTVSVTYSSTNPAVATVDTNGNVTFIAGGKATIITKTVSQTVDSKGRVKTKTTTVKKTVTVKQPVASISLSLGDAAIARTQKVKLVASIFPATASNKKVKWTSSNAKVASVSSSGVVTGKAGGTAVITCTASDGSGASASCTVAVTPIYPTGVKMSKAALSVKAGKTASLKATVMPKNTDFKAVTWASNDPSIATVDTKGRVRGISPGTVIITATTSSGQTAVCIVTVK